MRLTGDNKFEFQAEVRAFSNLIHMHSVNLGNTSNNVTDLEKTFTEIKNLTNKFNTNLSKYEN